MSLINDALKRARKVQTPASDEASAPTTGPTPPPLQPVETTATASTAGRRSLLLILPALLLSVLGGALLWNGWQGERTIVHSRTVSASTEATPTSTSRPRSKDPTPEASKPAAPTPPTPRLNPVAAASNVVTRAATEKNSILDDAIPSATPTVAISPKPAPQAAAPPVAGGNPGKTPEESYARAGAADAQGIPVIASTDPSKSTATAKTTRPNPQPTMAPISHGPVPPFKLQGIFYRVKNPTALIDGRVLSVRDDIEGWRVVEIDRHAVKLGQGARTHLLTLR